MQEVKSLGGSVFSVWLTGTLLAWAGQASTLTLTGRIQATDGGVLSGSVEVLGGTREVRAQSYWTDSQGQFSIEVEATPRLLVVARADGYISAEQEVAQVANTPEIRVDFRLYPAGSVSGRVVDENGRAVAGARVGVHYPGEVRRVVYDQEAGNVRADDFGYFSLPFVAQQRDFAIAAASEQHLLAFSAPLTLSGKSLEGVSVVVGDAGQTVRVNVVSPGDQPVEGAMVRLSALADSETYTDDQRKSRIYRETVNRRASTGTEGLVQFDAVPAGKLTLVATRPGGKPVKHDAVVERGLNVELTISVP